MMESWLRLQRERVLENLIGSDQKMYEEANFYSEYCVNYNKKINNIENNGLFIVNFKDEEFCGLLS